MQNIDLDKLFGILAHAVVFVACIPAHECAHGWVAYKLGDRTAKDQKRLTLNPARHFDFFGTLSLILLGFGWAKPVPIDPRQFKISREKRSARFLLAHDWARPMPGNADLLSISPKLGMALTAAAGPLANLIMAFGILLIFKILYLLFALMGLYSPAGAGVLTVLQYMVLTNISLAVFNLIPINPLDGSRILGVILPDKVYFLLMRHERVIYFVLLLVLLSGFLSGPIQFIAYYVLRFLNFATSFMDVLAQVILS